MTRRTAWFLHLSAAVVGGTGIVYGWMRYFATPQDPFSLVNHPQQPLLHALHIVLAPLLVFGCGLLWRNHVWGRIRSGFPSRRWTGLVLFALFGPMAVSGYLLQVAVDATWKDIWIWVHLATSCLWLVAYGLHQFAPRTEGTQASD